MSRSRLLATAAVLLLAIVLATLHPRRATMGTCAASRDQLPARALLVAFINESQPPWLDVADDRDRPLFASPTAAFFYPGTWLSAALPPAVDDTLIPWLHFTLAIGGMYRLLRLARLSRAAAYLGGAAFALSGSFFFCASDPTFQQSAAWAPWVLGCLARYSARGGVRDLAGAAAIVALQALAGNPPVTIATSIAAGVLVLGDGRQSRRAIARTALCLCCAGALATVQWLPTLASWNALAAETAASVDPAQSPAMAATPYTGALPLLLALVALRNGRCATDHVRRWTAVLVLSLIGALLGAGSWIPQALRPSGAGASAPWLLLLNLSLAALAAGGAHDLTARLSPHRARIRAAAQRLVSKPLLATAFLLIGVLAIALLPGIADGAACLFTRPRANLSMLFAAALFAVAAAWAVRLAARNKSTPRALPLLAIVTTIELGAAAWMLGTPAPAAADSPDRAPAATNARHEIDVRLEDATTPGAAYAIARNACSFTTRIDVWPSRLDGDHAAPPARVIVNRRWLPGWRAHAGQRRWPVQQSEAGWLTAQVPRSGPIEIVWSYAPPGLPAGALVSALSLVALIVFARSSRRSEEPPQSADCVPSEPDARARV